MRRACAAVVQLLVQAVQLLDQLVQPFGGILAFLVQVADLLFLGVEQCVARSQIGAQRREFGARALVAINESRYGFLEMLEIMNAAYVGNRPPSD